MELALRGGRLPWSPEVPLGEAGVKLWFEVWDEVWIELVGSEGLSLFDDCVDGGVC
jgi:hypothetical protein